VRAFAAAGFWDTFRHRLVVTGELVCDTALRVGAGTEALLPSASDLPVVTTGGRPYIPGSSLRGVVRSQVERLVRTLEREPRNGRGACDPLEDTGWCIPRKEMQDLRRKVRERDEGRDDWLAQQVWERSCRVCRIFGSPWLASRVRFSDLFPLGETHPEVRDGVAIDREREAVKNKYDFEVVPAGTRFALEIMAENLGTPAERSLLWLGLQELAEGGVPVGGFKGRGLGRVHLEHLRVRYVDATDREALQAYLVRRDWREAGTEERQEWLNAFFAECGGEAGA